jgi:hypothetical protein
MYGVVDFIVLEVHLYQALIGAIRRQKSTQNFIIEDL